MTKLTLLTAEILCLLLCSVRRCDAAPAVTDTVVFAVDQILSRPTDRSITITLVPNDIGQVYCEFGTETGVYPNQSETRATAADVPLRVELTNLVANKRYYYRIRYRSLSANEFSRGDEHTFCTQRTPGNTFRFTVEADPHPYDKKGSHALWPISLKNQLADSADFLLDLGDTFGDDHNPLTITSDEMRQLHLDSRRFFAIASHSSPLFLCLGNHEGESGYFLLQTPPDNLAVYGTLWRKYYYANPVPDGFYSGNTNVEDFGIGLPENYYAWEWSDALFVVLDSYRGYTVSAKPRGWEWTLGDDQYNWLKRTLEASHARFKFVFAHHTLGETRGGAITAKLFEWGGYEADGVTWGFGSSRPGWTKPIHQLMVDNGVNIFFQGHDHLFAREDVDGMIYQEVPMPSDSTYAIGMRDNGDSYSGVKLEGSGHLRVTVAPDSVKVEYVQAWLPGDENIFRHNRQVAYSYLVKPRATCAPQTPGVLQKVRLEQNFPNPFNPKTSISYQLSVTSNVKLVVYDLLGREVAVLVDSVEGAGNHSVQWDAAQFSSGIYYYRLKAGEHVVTKTMLLLQ